MVVRLAILVCAASARSPADLLKKARNEPFDFVFVNPYDAPREILWLGPGAAEPVPMGEVAPSGELNLNTYDGHEFGWRAAAETCASEETCAADGLEGRVTAARGFRRHVLGEVPKMTDAAAAKRAAENPAPFAATFANASPRAMALTDVATGEVVTVEPGASVEREAARGRFFDWADAATGELLYRSVVERHGQARHVFRPERYLDLCAEATPPSAGVRNATYRDPWDRRDVEVQILREDPLIAFLPDWTVGEECAAMERQALGRGLSAAQVFGEESVIADRRAISANLEWDRRNATAVSNRLIERAFAFTRDQRGYKLEPGHFQEPLNFIQYAVAGEYRPHCDGVCQRRPYARGGRVATLLHYCRAPTVGGATVFPKAGLKVQPTDGSAVLFAYKRDDGHMDDGFTLHTGCLVREGTKQIVTMWMREDVSDAEPWSDFLS